MGNLTKKRILYPILIFIILLVSFDLQHYYKSDTKLPWREVANFVATNSDMDRDAAVFCQPFIQLPFDYYYTAELEGVGISKTVGDTQELAALVDSAVRGKDRLWLVLSYGGQDAPIRSYLVGRYGSEAILLEKQFRRGQEGLVRSYFVSRYGSETPLLENYQILVVLFDLRTP